jgi:hypothetical protein
MRIIQSFIILVALMLSQCGCDDSPCRPMPAFPMSGTWIMEHITFWDRHGNVEDDFDTADRGWLRIQSYFPGGSCQSLADGPYLRYLAYSTFEWNWATLTTRPDSLLDADGVIHVWNPETEDYDPPVVIGLVVVRSYPSASSILWVEQDSLVVQRFEAPRGEVTQSVWRQESPIPIDLREHLLEPTRETTVARRQCEHPDTGGVLAPRGLWNFENTN